MSNDEQRRRDFNRGVGMEVFPPSAAVEQSVHSTVIPEAAVADVFRQMFHPSRDETFLTVAVPNVPRNATADDILFAVAEYLLQPRNTQKPAAVTLEGQMAEVFAIWLHRLQLIAGQKHDRIWVAGGTLRSMHSAANSDRKVFYQLLKQTMVVRSFRTTSLTGVQLVAACAAVVELPKGTPLPEAAVWNERYTKVAHAMNCLTAGLIFLYASQRQTNSFVRALLSLAMPEDYRTAGLKRERDMVAETHVTALARGPVQELGATPAEMKTVLRQVKAFMTMLRTNLEDPRVDTRLLKISEADIDKMEVSARTVARHAAIIFDEL